MVRPKFWPDCTRRSGDTLMPHTPSHVLLNFICQSVVFIVPSAFALIRSLGVIGSQSCRTVWPKNCAALELFCPNDRLQVLANDVMADQPLDMRLVAVISHVL